MPEITKMLALCTAHLTEDTSAAIDDPTCAATGVSPFIAYPKTRWDESYGSFVCVPPKEVEPPNVPDDLRACFAYARWHRCDWIMFDRDVEPVDDLPIYEW